MNQQKEWRPLPKSITIKESTIEGLGVFATQDISDNTDLGISHVYDKRFPNNYIRLPLGAFINTMKCQIVKLLFLNLTSLLEL